MKNLKNEEVLKVLVELKKCEMDLKGTSNTSTPGSFSAVLDEVKEFSKAGYIYNNDPEVEIYIGKVYTSIQKSVRDYIEVGGGVHKIINSLSELDSDNKLLVLDACQNVLQASRRYLTVVNNIYDNMLLNEITSGHGDSYKSLTSTIKGELSRLS